jgi:hypothetical protein
VTTRVLAEPAFHAVLHQTSTVEPLIVMLELEELPQQGAGGLAGVRVVAFQVVDRSGVYRMFCIAVSTAPLTEY